MSKDVESLSTSDLFFLMTMKQESENLILSLKFLSAILQSLMMSDTVVLSINVLKLHHIWFEIAVIVIVYFYLNRK